METFHLKNDIAAIGFQVKTFPQGIGEAFDSLYKTLPEGPERTYYGISWMTPDRAIVYNVAATEKSDSEAVKYNYERFIIEKGQYLTITVKGWMTKTDSIKDVFGELMRDKRMDETKPCVEWYKSDDEMMCMIKMKD
jgi:predicted transcriptional regulator YdeE